MVPNERSSEYDRCGHKNNEREHDGGPKWSCYILRSNSYPYTCSPEAKWFEAKEVVQPV